MNWYLKVFKQYADFTGRARRKEYWMFVLFNFIVLIIIGLIDFLIVSIADGQIPYGLLSIMYSAVILIPSLAVTVRRLHDTSHGGGWFFISFATIIGSIWLFVLTLLDSKPGVNRFGVNPKEEVEREKDKTKSAAVALIVASSIWLATLLIFDIIAIFRYGSYDYLQQSGIYTTNAFTIILRHIHYLTPITLLIIGISLLNKRSEKQFAAIFSIVVALILLVVQVRNLVIADVIFSDQLMFNINIALEILYAIIIPFTLAAIGLLLLKINNKPIIDPKIASLSLLVVGLFGILKIIYQLIVFPILIAIILRHHYEYSVGPIFSTAAMTIVFVTLMVLGSSLRQNKDNIPEEDERVLECKKIYHENRSPIKMGFAIVSICVGVILFMASIMMFFDSHIAAYALIPLTISLFLWIIGICGLVVRKRSTDEKLIKSMRVLTLIAFILSCATVAFVIITPIMIEIFN